MNSECKYWFKAKESGLRWSWPLTWQGWLVYTCMFTAIAYFFVTGDDVGQKILGAWIPILVCIPICWAFGEPLSRGTRSKR
jgi:hypothetical protein